MGMKRKCVIHQTVNKLNVAGLNSRTFVHCITEIEAKDAIIPILVSGSDLTSCSFAREYEQMS